MEKETKNNSSVIPQDATVFLETELVLADSISMEGVISHKLKKGNLVLAKIVDQRDIAQYLAHLLGGKKEEEIVPLTIAVDKIEIDQDNVKVYTRFSPRVVGLSCLCLQDKVKIIKKEKISFFKRFLKFF
ncbi:hypothetical protein KAI68_01295 [bacterium]|nr:hypothetical protein [bacterium]